MSFYIYTTFHISLTYPFTKPYTPTPYTPIPSINIPFLTTISPISSILKTPKRISALNHLLFFHLLSSLFHKHKTFHLFSNPSRINSPFSFYLLYLFFHFSFLIFYISSLLVFLFFIS